MSSQLNIDRPTMLEVRAEHANEVLRAIGDAESGTALPGTEPKTSYFDTHLQAGTIQSLTESAQNRVIEALTTIMQFDDDPAFRQAARKRFNAIHEARDLSHLERLALDGLRAAQTLAHGTATAAGWYVDPKTGEPVERNFGEVVALMHSELSEALEADRKGLKDDKLPHRDGREVEFADVIIRILDTAAAKNLDVAGALIEKNHFNRNREDHKLENRRASGGKAY